MDTEIAQRIADVRRRIAAACAQAGRDPGQVLLLGASKQTSADACRQAIAAGIDALGENRVQELLEKDRQGAYQGAPVHFIGHLQRNKVRQVVGRAALIQSVDSLPLLQAIENEARRQELVQDILLEVNIGGEASKSGFAPQALPEAARNALELPHIRVRGLMTIPPAGCARKINIRYFQEMQALYIDMREKMFHNSFVYLSMGMSADFEDAAAWGATIVRVGSAIFGRRCDPT